MKGQMLLVLQESHVKDTCNMYPYVSGEFKPVESHTSESSFGEIGRDEAGMGHYSFYNYF